MNKRPQAIESREVDRACPEHGALRRFEFRGPWFRTLEAAAYVQCLHACGCPSVNAFYQWQRRYGVVAHRGRIAKAELDAALTSGRRRRLQKVS